MRSLEKELEIASRLKGGRDCTRFPRQVFTKGGGKKLRSGGGERKSKSQLPLMSAWRTKEVFIPSS